MRELSKFEIIYEFLADINTKNGLPTIFNRVMINEKGIYYLEKEESKDDKNKVININ